eukprot:3798560-Prymnesium_polylepis.1
MSEVDERPMNMAAGRSDAPPPRRTSRGPLAPARKRRFAGGAPPFVAGSSVELTSAMRSPSVYGLTLLSP